MTAPVTGAAPPARPLAQAAPAPPGASKPGGRCAGDQPLDFSRVKAACDHAQRLIKETQELVARAQALAQARADDRRAWLHDQPSGLPREMLHRSEYLRLLARLETMPVIEQAKGILMAQSGCTDTEAFDLLRRASQRSNVPVRELAAQIVANTVHACQPASKAG
jgi:ANTAR domain